ncbi:MAG TPA: hydroxyacylglutathione hydrolase [Burkholderiales bacterium]|nr:hydroxyacylglutathione hydrolase [Burkholderiales bacterium]
MPEKEFQVVPLRAFKDNYVWTLRNERFAAVVDPGEARPVLDYLAAEKLELVAILATHHHQDHVGGVAQLLERYPIPVYGPRGEPITTLTHPVGGGDQFALEQLGVSFEVLGIPGHTRAHVAYYGANMLFCGDTLFACGCGKAFEGTPQQLYGSLEKLMALPDDTLVYCGHEYTLANIGFAKTVEPDNAALLEREASDARLRREDRPTLPSTIGREKATNPFVRVTRPAVIASANKYLGKRVGDPAAVFAALRQWKNEF